MTATQLTMPSEIAKSFIAGTPSAIFTRYFEKLQSVGRSYLDALPGAATPARDAPA
jgi:hypothetical protein